MAETTNESHARSGASREAELRAFRKFASTALGVCQALLAVKEAKLDLPGGVRQSVRVRHAGGTAIVTRRSNPSRGRLEAMVLYALSARGGAVPRVLAYDGQWLIQEDVGERRLAQALDAADRAGDPAAQAKLLDAAVASLAVNQMAGIDSGLARGVATIGGKADWIAGLIRMPERLGQALGVPPPPLSRALAELLSVRQPRLIKWDARPGNAIATDDGRVVWIDWEHCGCRNALDDLGWLLADEYTPDWPEAEAAAIERRFPSFLEADEDPDAAARYLAAFMAVHSCVRAALILHAKRDEPWRDPEIVLAGDKVGVVKRYLERCLRRGARWAALAPETEALAPWLASLVERVPEDEESGEAGSRAAAS